jgi:hypothetical protein
MTELPIASPTNDTEKLIQFDKRSRFIFTPLPQRTNEEHTNDVVVRLNEGRKPELCGKSLSEETA